MSIFFTADTHFGHDSIRRNCNRPFETVEEMDAVMRSNWNAIVRRNDVVYHLGDFCFKPAVSPVNYIKSLNGRVHLIRGSHDERTIRECGNLFESVSDISTLKVDGQQIVLCHYALRVWHRSGRGSWHLYGHSHGRLSDDQRSLSFDIGVDCHRFYPLSYAQVKDLMEQRMERRLATGQQADVLGADVDE